MQRKTKIFLFFFIVILLLHFDSEDDEEMEIQTYGNGLMRLFVFNYVVNVTEISYDTYLKRLRKTLNRHEYPSDLHFIKEKFFQSYPCIIPKEIRIKHPTTKYVIGTNFTMPLFYTRPLGELGNAMGEYATLFAIGKMYEVSTALTAQLNYELNETFPSLSMEPLPSHIEDTDTMNCMPTPSEGTHNFAPSEIAAAGLFGLDCFEIQAYPFDIRIFNGVRNQILREFTFSDTIQQTVREFFTSVQESISQMKEFQNLTPTYIGVHARRSNYLDHMKDFGGTIPDDIYFIRGIQYYRKKFSMPIFIVSSDDMGYIKKVLENETNVFYSTGGTAGSDMAILSACNHSIFSVGSYGFWTAYLTGGEVLYADVAITEPYTFSKRFYEDARLANFIPIPGH